MKEFKDISFGYASAETEGAREPDLLKNGYLDFNNISMSALSGPQFLFLGYKGSGKSAIGEHIRVVNQDQHDKFTTQVFLADFPFSLFAKIVRGDQEPEAKYPAAWSWILLIYLLESFSKDEGLKHDNLAGLLDVVKSLGAMGLCPAKDVSAIVRTSSKVNFKINLPIGIDGAFTGGEQRPASDIPLFVDSLKSLVCGVQTDSHHYLIIDGLDDILVKQSIQYTSIGYLIFEVNRLNVMLTKNGIKAKIIILCRTDLFERVAGANKNKIRQDCAFDIDWYHDTSNPDNSMLIRAANLRASFSLGEDVNIFQKFIRGKIYDSDPKTYLLDMTRHTPRDFFQLLKSIQQFSAGDRLSEDEIKSGMRQYSINYFLPEIRDELAGYANSEEADTIFNLISSVKKRDFTFHEVAALASDIAPTLSEARISELFFCLFECSAIGNIQNKPGGTTHYTFKYRNRQSIFKKMESILLHKGLWKALNLV